MTPQDGTNTAIALLREIFSNEGRDTEGSAYQKSLILAFIKIYFKTEGVDHLLLKMYIQQMCESVRGILTARLMPLQMLYVACCRNGPSKHAGLWTQAIAFVSGRKGVVQLRRMKNALRAIEDCIFIDDKGELVGEGMVSAKTEAFIALTEAFLRMV